MTTKKTKTKKRTTSKKRRPVKKVLKKVATPKGAQAVDTKSVVTEDPQTNAGASDTETGVHEVEEDPLEAPFRESQETETQG